MHVKKLLPLAACLALAVAQDEPEDDAEAEGDDAGGMDLTAALVSVEELSSFVEVLGQFEDLLSQLPSLENITILAPSNEAFEMLTDAAPELLNDTDALTAILSYHVLNGSYLAENVPEETAFIPTSLASDSDFADVSGGQVVKAKTDGDDVVFISGLEEESTVSQADIEYDNGVIHVIDKVLTVPVNVSQTAVALNKTALIGALVESNDEQLINGIDSTPDLTVFAPTNEAFQAIGSLLANISAQDLASTLSYHVVAGAVGYSATLENGTSLETLNGENVTITVEDGGVFVNSAEVVIADVLVANGVIHCIDGVLNPANATSPDSESETQEPAFESASSASDVPFTSGAPTPTSTIPSPTPADGDGDDADSDGDAEEDGARSVQGGAMAVVLSCAAAAVLYNL